MVFEKVVPLQKYVNASVNNQLIVNRNYERPFEDFASGNGYVTSRIC
jgi:hypothetical protein